MSLSDQGPGTTLLETAGTEVSPVAFLATTVNVYVVPFVSPVTVMGLPLPVAVMLPGFEVTV